MCRHARYFLRIYMQFVHSYKSIKIADFLFTNLKKGV